MKNARFSCSNAFIYTMKKKERHLLNRSTPAIQYLYAYYYFFLNLLFFLIYFFICNMRIPNDLPKARTYLALTIKINWCARVYCSRFIKSSYYLLLICVVEYDSKIQTF